MLRVAAKDMSDVRFILRKSFHAGFGWSNLLEPGITNMGHFTYGYGFDWVGGWSQKCDISFGWGVKRIGYTQPWQFVWGPNASYRYQYKIADTDLDFHGMFWVKPFDAVPMKLGGGGSVDFLIIRSITKTEIPDYYGFSDRYPTFRIQPTVEAGLAFAPKKFRLVTPELMFHYGIMTTPDYFRRLTDYNWYEYNRHRVVILLNLHINIDPAKQRERKRQRKEERRKQNEEVK